MTADPVYNYTHFVEAQFEPWLNFEASPKLGRPIPDFTLTTLADETVALSDMWRQNRYTIVEFGSIT